MPDADAPNPPSLFATTLKECRELYISSGQLCVHEFPDHISPTGDKFIELMDDLHRALVLKIYVTVCEADRKWSREERHLAEMLFQHLWGKRLTGEELRMAAKRAAIDSTKLKWYALVRPFDQIVPLRDRIGTLETLVMRLANAIARADGQLDEREAAVIKTIQKELQRDLRPVPIDEATQHEEGDTAAQQAIQSIGHDAKDVHAATRATVGKASRPGKKSGRQPQAAKPDLHEALAELEGLIGLERVKDEIRTLTNYLKLQQRRGAAGLPDTEISLHMVFTGNPGTGKTTVARIVGKIFGAMGILKKGHLVETDRSGLVAEYMGQTGAKTQKKIDEALDGVLFVDEAYGLATCEHQDIFGSEALQVLLKRAEDDRDRLVVVLAGYPDEMGAMLRSNPGLSSRFNRILHFDDYTPAELARIFAFLCEKNHYKLATGTRARLILGLTELYRTRDRYFGNGRSVRNLFEQAIRRLANRVVDIPDLTPEQLMLLERDDIQFFGLPAEFKCNAADNGPWRFRVKCPGCGHQTKARGSYLGQKVRCNKCHYEFTPDWGEPVPK